MPSLIKKLVKAVRGNKEGGEVGYIPLHYVKVVLPSGKVVNAVQVSETDGYLKIVDTRGRVIILRR